MGRRVVVTGIGLICAVGNTTEEVWKNLLAGKSGVARITGFDPSQFACQIAAEVKNFDPLQFIEKKEIVEKVKQIISEQLGVDENEITPSASFVDDLGADSLDQVELVMALEEHFGVEIPDEDAEKLRTVQDAIAYIDKHAKVSK